MIKKNVGEPNLLIFCLNNECPKLLCGLGIGHRRRHTVPMRVGDLEEPSLLQYEGCSQKQKSGSHVTFRLGDVLTVWMFIECPSLGRAEIYEDCRLFAGLFTAGLLLMTFISGNKKAKK